MSLDPARATTPIIELPWERLLPLYAKAEDRLARLDERLRLSEFADGWRSRSDYRDAQAAMWIEGELVPMEDLVLHDMGMDIRTPTQELTRAATVLRARRRIWKSDPAWVMTNKGWDSILGRKPIGEAASRDQNVSEWITLSFDDEDRLDRWEYLIKSWKELPVILTSGLAMDAWRAGVPSERTPWFGTIVVEGLLRLMGKSQSHLHCLNIGLKETAWQTRPHRNATTADRVGWVFEAIAAAAENGVKEHQRLLLARQSFMFKLKGKRTNSKIPGLIDLLIELPVVTVAIAAKRLDVSHPAAQTMINDCAPLLREITGRKRYRAWTLTL